MGKKVQGFEKIVHHICRVSNAIAAVMLFLLMILGAADVIGRYGFNAPITGTLERGAILLALMVFLSWGHTQTMKGHVRVELFIAQFPPRLRVITNFLTTLFSLALFILIIWQSTLAAIEAHTAEELIFVIHWPVAPFQLFVPIGASFLCLVLIMELIQYLLQLIGRD